MVYGRRLGRPLTSTKQTSLERGSSRFGFQLPSSEAESLELNTLFDKTSTPLALEIGFGYGEHLLLQCQERPEWCFIGCEPFVNGVSNFYDIALTANIHNVRVFQGDAVNLMNHLPEGCLNEIYVLFPDPWPKKRHHKRRLLQTTTFERFHQLLKPNGTILIATDHLDYQDWIEQHILKFAKFSWLNQQTPHTPPLLWTETRYQAKARLENRSAHFFKLQK